jgi:uncharacterized membrane protein YkvA (DUF1232 family)
MSIRARLSGLIRSSSIEFIAIWFAFRDRRVRWHVKLFLFLPIAYVVSPLDILTDAVPLWGQIDDIVVLRISYLLIRKIVDPAVLSDSRAQATAFWDAGRSNRMKFWLTVALVWGFTIMLVSRYLFRKFFRHP